MAKVLSVREFAERAGVSRQAIHKQLTTKLSNYVHLVDGKTRIDIRALSLYNVSENVNLVDEKDNQKSNQINKEFTALLDVIEVLKEQLKVKDKQIEELSERLADSQRLQGREQELFGKSIISLEDKQNTTKKKWWFQGKGMSEKDEKR